MESKATTRFLEALDESEAAPVFARQTRRPSLMAALQGVLKTSAGQQVVLEAMPRLVALGLFEGGPWETIEQLVPRLVPETLKVGGATTQLEILSELRLLAIADGSYPMEGITAKQALAFLQEVLTHCLELAFPSETEELRSLSGADRAAIAALMARLLAQVGMDRLAQQLAEEVEQLTAQRPIVTERVRRILKRVRDDLGLDPARPEHRRLQRYLNAVYAPTPAASRAEPERYARELPDSELSTECLRLAESLNTTGLVSRHHAALLERVVDDPERLALLLGVDEAGRIAVHRHHRFLRTLLSRAVAVSTPQVVYGVARLLERGLLDRQPVIASLKRLLAVELHDAASARILRTVDADAGRLAGDILLADSLRVLGQPLGVGQGGSPTCQSARGISLWSQHAPGKLLEMILTAAQTDDLTLRFEGSLLHSRELPPGLMSEVDYTLDAVSVVLVPHLDRIYNEMMRRAALRGDDPHRWVNPALYGHWIPTGFAAAYDPMTASVPDFRRFVRLFLAAFHPQFNGGFNLIYPCPAGLVVTSAAGRLVGFHAVSLLRTAAVTSGEVRAYFLNPNEEGRQDWGQGITPTVVGHAERPGESSLPVAEFVSRIYAFHYNPGATGDPKAVPDDLVDRIETLARESWGRSYSWVSGRAAPAPLPGIAR